MLQKNLKTLKRSISEKLLGKPNSSIKIAERSETPAACSRNSSSSSTSTEEIEEDPYREILRNYHDNVSHLVFHGSSLVSMSSMQKIK
ncbi:unnamed protein product [Auanema sp. JU1783]|nr:unnamed protein product [Auanema sp. JU1783]